MLHFLAVGHFYSYFFMPTKCLTKYVLCVFRSRSRSPKRRRSHSRSQSPRSDKQLIFFFSVNTLSLFICNVQFQKISIPTSRTVTGNSKGEGGLISPNIFYRKYEAKLEILGGWEGLNQITILGGCMVIFWSHTINPFFQITHKS